MSKREKKAIARQLEVDWQEAEPFALQIKQTLDGDWIATEAQRAQADRELSESLQMQAL